MAKKQREKKKRSKPLLEDTAATSDSGLARALGSTDRDTREKGLLVLTQWLNSHPDASQNEIIRLWKALYYCFWHSDLVSVQTALADRLSGLVCTLSPTVAFMYFSAFVVTMKREWPGIDQHRMDKYMMLVRKFYAASLELFDQSHWNVDLIRSYSTVWKDTVVLLPYANDLGVGLAYHVCSVVVSELEKMVEAGARPSHDALRAVLDPFIEGLRASENKVLLKKIYSDVFAEIAQRVESNAEPFGSMCDVQSLAQELFSLGSHKKTKSKNREYLYLASSDVEQALKHAKKKAVVKKSKKKAAKKEDEIPVRIVQEAPEEEEEEEDQVEKTIAEAPKSQENKKKKKKKKKAKSNTDSEPASGSHENGIDATPHHIDDEPSQKIRRKSVRFSLKKNLVRRIGQPPFPENVRTPPTSKPKGSALKQMPLASQNRKRMLTFSDAVDEPSSLEAKTKKKKKKDVKKKKKMMMMSES
ncbi:hypothetical protein M9435_003584 [Picochlorum sp. BPE23]|nr:hypothetical protein M9435_003584 [Picochlorum sp. BPE23]